MGADVFFTASSGKTAQEAFGEAQRRARHDYGHAGYPGTIAEKGEFAMIATPDDGGDPGAYANKLINDCDYRVDDKWGPAGCIQLSTDPDTGMKDFLFFGWASS